MLVCIADDRRLFQGNHPPRHHGIDPGHDGVEPLLAVNDLNGVNTYAGTTINGDFYSAGAINKSAPYAVPLVSGNTVSFGRISKRVLCKVGIVISRVAGDFFVNPGRLFIFFFRKS